MKKTNILLFFLLLGIIASAQNSSDQQRKFPWRNITVGTEFCHTVERGYAYPDGVFRNHPNNSLNLFATYDFSRKFTLGLFGGYYGCERGLEYWENGAMYNLENGTSSKLQLVNRISFSFGIDATLHLLSFLYDDVSPYDLFVTGRIGKNPRDLDLGVGIGLSYSPLHNLYIFGKVYEGAFGFPNGVQEEGVLFHAHLVAGVSYRIK